MFCIKSQVFSFIQKHPKLDVHIHSSFISYVFVLKKGVEHPEIKKSLHKQKYSTTWPTKYINRILFSLYSSSPSRFSDVYVILLFH